jgi:exosortase A-associated hydrolase 2
VITAEFIASARGSVFVLMRRPAGSVRQTVLIVPPFAEEMNKSRKMIAELMRGLEQRGVASVLPDLYGTGESEGEFRDADWSVWQDDLTAAARWAAARGCAVTAMASVRLGCTLAVQAMRHDALAHVARHVFWQPVLDGQRFLTQFLRLRVAASMMNPAGKETVQQLRGKLEKGETLEVAGYDLTSNLAQQIDKLSLLPTPSALADLHWFEVPADAQSGVSPATENAVTAARTGGTTVQMHSIPGLPFWATTEIAVVPELVTKTADVLACE